jgi:hypothetical protein
MVRHLYTDICVAMLVLAQISIIGILDAHKFVLACPYFKRALLGHPAQLCLRRRLREFPRDSKHQLHEIVMGHDERRGSLGWEEFHLPPVFPLHHDHADKSGLLSYLAAWGLCCQMLAKMLLAGDRRQRGNWRETASQRTLGGMVGVFLQDWLNHLAMFKCM